MQRIEPKALRWLRVRLLLLGVGMGTGLVLLGVRAYRLQVEQAAKLSRLAAEQYTEQLALPARRGSILDRNGKELAVSLSVDSVAASPPLLGDPVEAARRLAPLLGLDVRDLAARLAGGGDFVWVERRVSEDEARAVANLGMAGVSLVPESRRYYPERELAGPVLGVVGADGVGLDGIELSCDRFLRGSPGRASGLRDALGHVMLTGMPDTAPTEGRTVVTTLDATIQYVAERALADGVAAAHARSGSLVAIDPATGEVLALAAVPSSNPNAPGRAPARDRPVTDAYEPGSTMKVFTVGAALDAGAVQPDDTFDGMQGALRVGSFTIHDDEPHGVLTVRQVIQVSSNVCAAQIARRLGRERLEEALRRFGFGRPTHIGLPGEAGGILRPSRRWGDVGLATIAFGQGLTATPVQLVSALAAVAEGGIYHPPHVIERVIDAQGNVVWQPDATPRRVMSARAAAEMDAMLRQVLEKGGTAEGMSPPGYPAAGKTGTAQRVDPGTGRYSKDHWTASFMGYVPADRPRLAMIVVIDDPQGTHFGGKVAAPVFQEVAAETMRYLGVPPEVPVAAGTPASGPVGADMVTVAGPPSASTSTSTSTCTSASTCTSTSTGIGDIVMPDFTGMSIPEALRAALAAHCDLRVGGSGRAEQQSPGPGPAAAGTVCRVAFAPPG